MKLDFVASARGRHPGFLTGTARSHATTPSTSDQQSLPPASTCHHGQSTLLLAPHKHPARPLSEPSLHTSLTSDLALIPRSTANQTMQPHPQHLSTAEKAPPTPIFGAAAPISACCELRPPPPNHTCRPPTASTTDRRTRTTLGSGARRHHGWSQRQRRHEQA
jgi:hypothetical protein